MVASGADAWDELWYEFDAVRSSILASRAVNVNADVLRTRVQQLVQTYFRRVRPELAEVGVSDDALGPLDAHMQRLIELSQGRNAKSSYIRALRGVQQERTRLYGLRERMLGEYRTVSQPRYEETDSRILTTLTAMLPDSAASFEQALIDLRTGRDRSWRGTSVELREVVREVLDHLAPDDAVTKEAGFKLEKDRQGPTMRQKAAFVFRSRGLSASKRKTPQDAINIVDELTAAFVRSIYQRGSGSTHGAPTQADVAKLKMYVDIALVELLETSGA